MVRIELTAEFFPGRPGKDGKQRPGNQVGYVTVIGRDGKPEPHPRRFLFPIWEKDGERPLDAGQYTLAPGSVYVDRFSSLALAPKLVPLQPGRGGAA